MQEDQEVNKNPLESHPLTPSRNYEMMNYMMAFYSGLLFLTFYSNLNHVMKTLDKTNFQYTRFYNLTASSWTFKPIFGWISDSFYPFRYR
jgi:hypothetical protein